MLNAKEKFNNYMDEYGVKLSRVLLEVSLTFMLTLIAIWLVDKLTELNLNSIYEINMSIVIFINASPLFILPLDVFIFHHIIGKACNRVYDLTLRHIYQDWSIFLYRENQNQQTEHKIRTTNTIKIKEE